MMKKSSAYQGGVLKASNSNIHISRTLTRDKSRFQFYRCVQRPMNCCPAPRSTRAQFYSWWSSFHAKTSLQNISRKILSLVLKEGAELMCARRYCHGTAMFNSSL
jgi:hypothetical protein